MDVSFIVFSSSSSSSAHLRLRIKTDANPRRIRSTRSSLTNKTDLGNSLWLLCRISMLHPPQISINLSAGSVQKPLKAPLPLCLQLPRSTVLSTLSYLNFSITVLLPFWSLYCFCCAKGYLKQVEASILVPPERLSLLLAWGAGDEDVGLLDMTVPVKTHRIYAFVLLLIFFRMRRLQLPSHSCKH